jgi:hypothetical protein
MPLRLYNCKEFVKSLFHGMNQIGQFSMWNWKTPRQYMKLSAL